MTRRGEFFAAVLAYGPDAALSHPSAGHEHAIRRHEYGPIHVTVPRIELGPWEADFLWPDYGLVVEIDAWFTHGNPRSFQADRDKDEFPR